MKEAAGFGVAEILSEGVWLGLVAVEDRLIPKKLLSNVSRTVGKVCIEPFLDPIEKGLNAVCKLDECKPDPTKSREERAEQLARAVIMYVPAIWLAWEAKIHTRRFMNEKVGIREEKIIKPDQNAPLFDKIKHYALLRHWSPQEKMIFLSDEGMHLGALYVLNNQLATYTGDMIQSTTGMIKKVFGTSDAKSHELATAAWVWAVPNGIGAIGGFMAITAKHALGWPKGVAERILGGSHHHPPGPPAR